MRRHVAIAKAIGTEDSLDTRLLRQQLCVPLQTTVKRCQCGYGSAVFIMHF